MHYNLLGNCVQEIKPQILNLFQNVCLKVFCFSFYASLVETLISNSKKHHFYINEMLELFTKLFELPPSLGSPFEYFPYYILQLLFSQLISKMSCFLLTLMYKSTHVGWRNSQINFAYLSKYTRVHIHEFGFPIT